MNDNSPLKVKELLQEGLTKTPNVSINDITVNRGHTLLKSTTAFIDINVSEESNISIHDNILQPLKDMYGERLIVPCIEISSDRYKTDIIVMDKILESHIEPIKKETLMSKLKRRVLRK